jgi:hypothetical protein
MKQRTALAFLVAFALVIVGFSGHALGANLSLQATSDGFTSATQFMRGDSIYLNIVVDDSTDLAGCAFTVTYNATLLDPPATTAEGTPVDNSVTSVFPFTFQGEEMHRENSAESGKVYLAGATINESTGGAKPGQTDAVLFTLIFKVKNDAAIGSTFSFGLEQTELMNPAAGYGTDVDSDGVYDPGDGDEKDPVTVLVGAVAQGEEGYDNFDCANPPCAFPEIQNNLPVSGEALEVVATPTYSVGGTIAYAGPQTGNILVGVFKSAAPGLESLVSATMIAAPGDFSIADVPQGTGYYLAAFRDSDGGADLGAGQVDMDPSEAQGMLLTPFDVTANVSGLFLTLTDPDNNGDGIPDYWYPGIGGANDDFDQDGYTNLVEYQNQTDPTVEDAPFGTGYDAATDGRGPYQVVNLSPVNRGVQPGGSFELTVNYDVTDGNSLLSGLDISIHFDSSKVSYEGYNNFSEIGDTTSPPTLLDDTQNEDGDASTDKRINMSWSSISKQWPNVTLPAVLAKLNFKLSDTMTEGESYINVSAFDKDPDYSFYGTGSTVFVQDWTVDIDANSEAKPLTDGLLAIRYLFRYHLAGPSWIEGFVAGNAERNTAAEIESYLADAVTSLALDIDGNGECKPLTDGLLLIRYLFRYNLAGPSWVEGFVASNATRTTAAEIEAYLQSIMP